MPSTCHKHLPNGTPGARFVWRPEYTQTMDLTFEGYPPKFGLKQLFRRKNLLLSGVILLSVLVGGLIFTGVFLKMGHARREAAVMAFEAQTGIRVVRLAMTAGGGMVDLQYQVIDPGLAVIVHDDERPLTLTDQRTGIQLATPFHSHAPRNLHAGATYHFIILNAGGVLRRGRQVDLTIAGFRLADLTIE